MDKRPSSLVFAANAPEPTALWAWGDNNFCKKRLVGYSGDNEAARCAVESGLFDTFQTSFNVVDQGASTDGLLALAAERA